MHVKAETSWTLYDTKDRRMLLDWIAESKQELLKDMEKLGVKLEDGFIPIKIHIKATTYSEW